MIRILVLFIVLLNASCANITPLKIQKPSITLAETKLSGLSLEGAKITLKLNIQNPNSSAIKLAGFDYALNINEQKVGGGQQRKIITLAAESTHQIDVPMTLTFSEIFKLIGGLADNDELNYQVSATVYLDLPVLGVQAISREFNGSLPLPKRPAISLTDIKLDRIDIAGASIVIGLQIDNPNAFDIDLNTLAYRLIVNEQEWVNATTETVTSLASNGSSKLEVPLNINFFDIGGAIFKALKDAQPLNYRLQGDMLVKTDVPLLDTMKVPFDQLGSFKAAM